MGKRFLFGFSMFFALIGVLALDHYAHVTWGFFAICLLMCLGGIYELGRMFKARGLPLDTGLLYVTTIVMMCYVQLVAEPPRIGAFASLWKGDPDFYFWVPVSFRHLTLVLPLKPGHGVASLVTAGLPTLAVRVPAHPAAQALLADLEDWLDLG